MKTSSLLLCTALLALSVPPLASAQTAGPKVIAAQHPKTGTHYDVNNPEMSDQAVQLKLKGAGVVEAVFDEKGKVTKVTMSKSTGSGMLDGLAIAYAKRNWKCTPGNASTVSVPIRMGMDSPTGAKSADPSAYGH